MSDATAPPELDDLPAGAWQKLVAVAYLAVVVAAVVAFRGRLSVDFWPPDDARVAPNLLASAIIVAGGAPFVYLLYPPVRRRVHRLVGRHTAPIHAQFDRLRSERAADHAETLAAHTETQRRLAHIILHHPDIPPLPPKGT